MYKRLNDEAYTKLRKDLLKKDETDLQREFLTAALSNEGFLAFMRDVRGIMTEGTKDLEVIDRLSESEYTNPPEDTERAMYTLWQDLPPETACRVTFWGEVTLNHIQQEKIQAYYLAAGTDTSSGVDRIRKALSKNGDTGSCVRTIIRNMSGIPEKRGISACMPTARSAERGGEYVWRTRCKKRSGVFLVTRIRMISRKLLIFYG